MSTIVMIILILLILGSVWTAPIWPHSNSWGPWPSSGLGLVLIVLLILFLMGRL